MIVEDEHVCAGLEVGDDVVAVAALEFEAIGTAVARERVGTALALDDIGGGRPGQRVGTSGAFDLAAVEARIVPVVVEAIVAILVHRDLRSGSPLARWARRVDWGEAYWGRLTST
nr:hypothetical protein [Limimonas halophila]